MFSEIIDEWKAFHLLVHVRILSKAHGVQHFGHRIWALPSNNI